MSDGHVMCVCAHMCYCHQLIVNLCSYCMICKNEYLIMNFILCVSVEWCWISHVINHQSSLSHVAGTIVMEVLRRDIYKKMVRVNLSFSPAWKHVRGVKV
jgi:hypothetical protein